jgi:hypothetical protein
MVIVNFGRPKLVHNSSLPGIIKEKNASMNHYNQIGHVSRRTEYQLMLPVCSAEVGN